MRMTIVIGFLFGTIGLAYAVYGKKAEEYSFLIFGVLLMAYSYFVPGVLWGSIVGALLAGGPFIMKRYF